MHFVGIKIMQNSQVGFTDSVNAIETQEERSIFPEECVRIAVVLHFRIVAIQKVLNLGAYFEFFND